MAHNKKLGKKHHEVIGQQSFLGASVCNFTVSLGYGSQPSRLSLNLVEDAEHDQTPEGKTRFFNAVEEGYHPWLDTIIPFNLHEAEHSDNLGQMPPAPARAEGGEKYPPHTGGRLGKKVLQEVDHPSQGSCSDDSITNEAGCLSPETWTKAKVLAYVNGDKFYFVGKGRDANGNDTSKTMLGGPVWFNWYRYDKVDAEDPTVPDGGKEDDIIRQNFSHKHPWYFNGLLTSVEENHSTGSGRIISATIEDPRAILAGTHVILGKFQGKTMNADGSTGRITSPYPQRFYKDGYIGYYNVLNVYGFLEEAYGFGAVDKNESGIIWWDKKGDNSAEKVKVGEPPKDSGGNEIGTLEDYAVAPGSNVIDVLQWMLMGSADAEHGKKTHGPPPEPAQAGSTVVENASNNIGWPRTREPGASWHTGERYHGPHTEEESDPDKQRTTSKPDGEHRIGQERYGGLLYYITNPLVNDIANIDPEKDYMYGPRNKDIVVKDGTLPTNANRFKVDLSELKRLHIDAHASGILDSNFRIQSDDMTLLDLIQYLCDYASADFFVELLPDIAPWPRGQKAGVCRDNATDEKIDVNDLADLGTAAQKTACESGLLQDENGQPRTGTWSDETMEPEFGEGVTGVIKIKILHRVKPPTAGLLNKMIEDSKFDPSHVDIGEAPPFDPKDSKHFKKWRGRLQSSKIGYEFAGTAVGRVLFGGPRTRLVGVDKLGPDFVRNEFGDCKDKDGNKVEMTEEREGSGVKVPIDHKDQKGACEAKGVCYDPSKTGYVTDGSCEDQNAVTPDPPTALCPTGGCANDGDEDDPISNQIDCEDTAMVASDGQWCAQNWRPARQRTDFDGAGPPTSRTGAVGGSTDGFFGDKDTPGTNQMQEDLYGRDIYGDSVSEGNKLYEKRDYRNDFWTNAVDDSPHLSRISGPDMPTDPILDDYWGAGGTAADQGVSVSLGGDDANPSSEEKLSDQPFFGDGSKNAKTSPGDHFGGDGYIDLFPVFGLHDRPDYCKMINSDPSGPGAPGTAAHEDGARVCGGIMGCSWKWNEKSDHSKGGTCGQTIAVQIKGVPHKGFFNADEPQKDFNPPDPQHGYPEISQGLDEDWTRYHPPAGLMSIYEWVVPNCNPDIYDAACKGTNTWKGSGYDVIGGRAINPNYKQHSRSRVRRSAKCEKCVEKYHPCEDENGDEATSNGACGSSGDPLLTKANCEDQSCWAGNANSTTWNGGGCKKWEAVEDEEINDMHDCFCDNESEFTDSEGSTLASCGGSGDEKFTEIPNFDEGGVAITPLIIDRKQSAEGAALPDSAIIEIDMSEVYKTGEGTQGLEQPLYIHGEDFGGAMPERKHIYMATVTELRAAAASKTCWEDYLAQFGVRLNEDMGWKSNAVDAIYQTTHNTGRSENGSGADERNPSEVGKDGMKVTAAELMQIKPRGEIKRTGEVVGKSKMNTSSRSITHARSAQTQTDSNNKEDIVSKQIDTIFKKINEVAQEFYGKAYVMPLPYDPEDIEAHVRSVTVSDKELESPKLELDWDIADASFVELEWDKFHEDHSLNYPLSVKFSTADGKMDGFFVFPKEYKGIQSVKKGANSCKDANGNAVNGHTTKGSCKGATAPGQPDNTWTAGQGVPPSNLKININEIAKDDRYVTSTDSTVTLGSNKRGKVYIKADIDPKIYWLWDDDFQIVDYAKKNHKKTDFRITDAFDPKKNGACGGEVAANDDDVDDSSNQDDCEDSDVNGTCSDDSGDSEATCGGTWVTGEGQWTPNDLPKLKPYAFLRMGNPVIYADGMTDREKALAGRASLAHVYQIQYDWNFNIGENLAFNSLGLDVLKSDLAPARFKPFGAAVPQVSNRHVWGPWALGIDYGKVLVEKDNTFEPANFGSIKAMNEAALSKIKADMVAQQITESGYVELTGGPEYFAGRPIGADADFIQYLTNIGIDITHGGMSPYITDIGVDTNPSAGVTTKYTMRSWTPRLGKLEDWKLREGIKMHKEIQRNNMEKNTDKHKVLLRSQALTEAQTRSISRSTYDPKPKN